MLFIYISWKIHYYILYQKLVKITVDKVADSGAKANIICDGSAKTLHVRAQILTYFYNFKMP